MEKIFTTITPESKYYPQFKADKVAVVKNISNSIENKPDSVEISFKNKESDKKQFKQILSLVGLGCLAVFAGGKFYRNAQNKLACGVKKTEIKEELFNFIKKNDPKCKYFKSRKAILRMNESMDEEKFLMIKKLYKMKSSYPIYSRKKTYYPPRFSFEQLDDLLEVTTKDNVAHLEKLSQVKHTSSIDNYTRDLSFEEIKSFMEYINTENSEIANKVIDNIDLSKWDSNTSLGLKLLKKVDKENIEIYKLLFNSRKSGNTTDLNFNTIVDLATIIKENENPEISELLINAKRKNGTDSYLYNIDTIKELLNNNLKDDKVSVVKELQESNSLADIPKELLSKLFNETNTNNIKDVKFFMELKGKEKYGNSNSYVFSKVKDIIEVANNISNMDFEKREFFFDLIKRIPPNGGSWGSDSEYVKTFIKHLKTRSITDVKTFTASSKDWFSLSYGISRTSLF